MSMKTIVRKLELLAPAKDAATAIAAITHGADAVYIGAPAFGARGLPAIRLTNLPLLLIMHINSVQGFTLPLIQ